MVGGRPDDYPRHRLVIRGALKSPIAAPAPPLEYPSSPAPTFGQVTAVGEPKVGSVWRARPIPEEAHITGPGSPSIQIPARRSFQDEWLGS